MVTPPNQHPPIHTSGVGDGPSTALSDLTAILTTLSTYPINDSNSTDIQNATHALTSNWIGMCYRISLESPSIAAYLQANMSPSQPYTSIVGIWKHLESLGDYFQNIDTTNFSPGLQAVLSTLQDGCKFASDLFLFETQPGNTRSSGAALAVCYDLENFFKAISQELNTYPSDKFLADTLVPYWTNHLPETVEKQGTQLILWAQSALNSCTPGLSPLATIFLQMVANMGKTSLSSSN